MNTAVLGGDTEKETTADALCSHRVDRRMTPWLHFVP